LAVAIWTKKAKVFDVIVGGITVDVINMEN